MADIELVVKIPEEMYKKLLNKGAIICLSGYEGIIANGIPLTKGHGRIGDLDKALVLINQQIDAHDKMLAKYEPYRNTQIPNWMWEGGICQQLTLIEADKEKKDDNT